MASTATIFQRNKRSYLDEESKLFDAIRDTSFAAQFQAWLDATIGQLDVQFDNCEQQLSELQQSVAVDEGRYWCGKTVMQHCNLHLDERRLITKSVAGVAPAAAGAATTTTTSTGGPGANNNGGNVGSSSTGAAATASGGASATAADNNSTAQPQMIPRAAAAARHPSWPDVIQLVSCLHQLKHRSFITPKQLKFIEQCEHEFQNIVFEPRELQFIANALNTKLLDDVATRGVFTELTRYQNAIDELAPDLVQCEELLEAALMNGEVALAEDISRKQLELYEHILKLICEQYPVIEVHHTEAAEHQRRRRWAVLRMANKDISTVIDSKTRQIEACEEDLLKIRDQLLNYNRDDAFQRKRYEDDRAASDTFLTQNKEKQQGCWNKVYELLQQLQQTQEQLGTLAQQRRREIDRRLTLEEREAGRRSGHDAFIHAAAAHAQKLQDTIDNALSATELATSLNDFVLDGADSVTAKYDRQQSSLSEMLRLVQHHHFKRFSDYTVAANRFLYRKEKALGQIESSLKEAEMKRELLAETLDPSAKRHATEYAALQYKRRDLGEEVVAIRYKLDMAEKAIGPTLQSFTFHSIPFVHPKDIADKMNTDRASRILDYRDMVNPSVTTGDRILHEEERQLTHLLAVTQRSAEEKAAQLQQQSSTKAPRAPHHQSAAFQRFQAILSRSSPSTTPAESPRPLTQQSGTRQTSSSTAVVVVAGGSNAAAATSSSVRSVGDVNVSVNSTTPAGGAAAARMPATTTSSRSLDGQSFRALYRYKARAADELSFEKGDVVVCIAAAQEEGWYRGVCNQRTGLFPMNYVGPLE